MPNDTRTASEIERDIELERARFRSTAEALQDRFQPERVLRELGDGLRDYGSDYGRAAARAARDNPVGLALTGIGLAWLAFGGRGGKSADRSAYRDSVRFGRSADPFLMDEDVLREDEAALYPAGRDFPSWAREHDHYSDPWADEDEGRLGRARAAVNDAAGQAGDTVSGAYADARGRIGAAGERLRRGAADTQAGFQARVARLRERLSRGTEDLSEEARERVIRARARAIEARDRASRAARGGQAAAGDFFREQPLVAGALAVAAGAALGGALPRSRTEDRWMGEHSDALYREAEAIYREERAKLERVAEAAGEEVRNVADDAATDLKHSAEAVREKAEEAANRVGEAAKDEADNQNLGDIRH
ncbi:DUF3618 domain-containing protein [Halovulum sp. GXIMD14794]